MDICVFNFTRHSRITCRDLLGIPHRRGSVLLVAYACFPTICATRVLDNRVVRISRELDRNSEYQLLALSVNPERYRLVERWMGRNTMANSALLLGGYDSLCSHQRVCQ